MEALRNKKIAIPILSGLGLLAILGAWWGISRMPQSGGIQTTNLKGEAALKSRADEDREMLSQLSVEDLRAIVAQRKILVQAAESYKVESDIKSTKEALERAEAVLKSK